MPDRPRVFVASSSEQIETADEVARVLRTCEELDVKVWKEDVFEFSKVYIESLEKELERADFAIVMLTADDAGNVRGNTVNLPRDNVIFELGLFTGRLGRDRCFFFIDGDTDTQIASDLSGVKSVEYYRNSGAPDKGKRGLTARTKKVAQQMLGQGLRYKPSRNTRLAQDEAWRFCTRLSGHWWERIKRSEDNESTLSYLTIAIDPVTNTPDISGRVFHIDGEPYAQWRTIVTGVVLGDQPTVYYRWRGKLDESPGQILGGGGEIVFADRQLQTGSGYFFDTNFAKLGDGAYIRVKLFRMYRSTSVEIGVMKTSWTDDASALIKRKIAVLMGK